VGLLAVSLIHQTKSESLWRGWNFGDCGYGVGEGRFDAILWVPGKPVPTGVCCIGYYCGLTRNTRPQSGTEIGARSQWRYLSLVVDGVGGQLWWSWTPNLKKETVQSVVREWQEAGIGVLVWDRVPGPPSQGG
jgi:hypothetical protein